MRTGSAMLLGMGMAAVYVLPAMVYQQYIYVEEFTSIGFEFYRGLITRELSLYGSMRYFWMIVDVGVVALVALLSGVFASMRRKEAIFWVAVIAMADFMMLYVSFPIWDYVTTLQMLQFPWRFNLVTCIAVVALITIGVSSARRGHAWLAIPLLLVLGYFAITWTMQVKQAVNTAYGPVIPHRSEFSERVTRLKLDTHALWPRSAPIRIYYDADSKLPELSGGGDGKLRATVVGGAGQVKVEAARPREIVLDVDAATASEVTVSQMFYPGWRARLQDSSAELEVTAQKDLGIMDVIVPAGHHQVVLKLERLWPEFLGALISALSIGFALGLFIRFARRPARSERRVMDQGYLSA